MNNMLDTFKSLGFSVENDSLIFDTITFGKISSRDRNSIDCYPFIINSDEFHNLWFDSNNMIFRSDSYYSYYSEFFEKYDYMFTVNKDGARMKLNSTSSDEVDLKDFFRDVLNIYLQIKNDVIDEIIDNF